MRLLFIILILSVIYFVRFNNPPLFDWDEINFAESAREMIVTGDYLRVQIDFKPFHEKPPLFIWLQVLSMKVFGINEYAARFPNAVIGILSMIVLFFFGKKIKDEKFATYWVAAYAGSFLPTFYFMSGIIDPLFNLLMFGSLIQLYQYYKNKQSLSSLINSSLLISLAVLTKGPVAIILIGFSWFLFSIFNKEYHKIKFFHFLIFFVIGITPYFIWYTKAYGGEANLVVDFIEYHIRLLTTEDAGHSGPWFYHFPVLLFGAFPASFFAFKGFKKSDNDDHLINSLNLLLLAVVLIVFSIVKTKILHYSSLAYFPLSFFAARGIERITKENFRVGFRLITGFSIIVFVALVLFSGLPYYASDLADTVKDKFTADILRTEINPKISGGIASGGLLLGIIYLNFTKDLKYSILFFLTTCTLTMYMFSSNGSELVASYTQRTPIEFFISKQKEDCYIEPLSYKTYAHFFYSNRRKENTASGNGMKYRDFLDKLLEGELKKPAYFVTKSTKFKKYTDKYNLEIIQQKNGWVFMKRLP